MTRHPTTSTTYHDAVVACREMGNAELLTFIEVRQYNLADADEVEAVLEIDRLRAGRNEWSRRQRLYLAGCDVPNPSDARNERWRDVARQVRERSDITQVFAEAGYPQIRVGTNSRRGGGQWAGPCLVCGGHDRLRVWSGPDGRAWCRQCGYRADVIAVSQTLLPERREWHAAVAYLARTCGITPPEETIPSHAQASIGQHPSAGGRPPLRRRTVTLTVPEGGHAR